MFKAAPGSAKPKRRIDAEPERWQAIRDDMHAMALEYGCDWGKLADRVDICPAMSGRDFELWQPLFALAVWLEDHGARGLPGIIRSHAERSIDAGRDDATPEADEILLRLLADAFRNGERITPHDLLAKAQAADAMMFRNWTSAGVSRRIRSYGIPVPCKSGGRREWRNLTIGMFWRIQTAYAIDLDIPDDDALI